MVEQNPQYSLEFILKYDAGSLTFRASGDNPWVVWCASGEIEHLNNSMVSNRGYDGTKVVVTLYKDGQPMDRSALPSEIEQYFTRKKQEKDK